MKTILITGIGGDIGQAVATILREAYPNIHLIGVDIHERHGGSLFVDKFLVAPPASSSEYLTWLDSLVTSEEVDICIPLSEAELVRIANSDGRGAVKVQLLMPSQSAINIGTDKYETAAFLKKIGCPGPWTVLAHEPDGQLSFPCIFKPRRGAGSKGVFVCDQPEEVRLLLKRYPDAVLQELLLPVDQEITCAVYRTKTGQVGVLQMLRQLAGDVTGWVEVIDVPEVRRQCETIAGAINLQGAINIQMRLTPEGPRIFEINPRFSSTVLIRHKIGFQDVVWAMKEVLGERVVLQGPAAGVRAVRIQGAMLL